MVKDLTVWGMHDVPLSNDSEMLVEYFINKKFYYENSTRFLHIWTHLHSWRDIASKEEGCIRIGSGGSVRVSPPGGIIWALQVIKAVIMAVLRDWQK